MNTGRDRVMVAMSGGVDSAITALLLQERGLEVVGMTIDTGVSSLVGDPVSKARDLCAQLGIPHVLVDGAKAFQASVIDDFVATYARGATPNPCIQCNRRIKFPLLLQAADEHGCPFVATGHYARIGAFPVPASIASTAPQTPSRPPVMDKQCRVIDQGGFGPGPDFEAPTHALLCALDASKDQSYVLYCLDPSVLSRLLLPLGELTKDEVRACARSHGLSCAEEPESQDICFVPDGDHVAYLLSHGLDEAPGDIVDRAGTVLGRHEGLLRYTIGQRRGIGLDGGEPWYVLRKDAPTRRLVVGHREQLGARECLLEDLNWLVPPTQGPLHVRVKPRYRCTAVGASVETFGGMGVLCGSIASITRLLMDEPFEGLAPGQSAVFYGDGQTYPCDMVLGGGIIR